MKILVNAISAKQGGIVTYTLNMIQWMASHRLNAVFAVPKSFDMEGPHILRMRASEYGPLARLAWEQTNWPLIVAHHRPDVLFSSANFGLLASPIPQVLLIREGGLFDPFYLTNFAPVQGVTTAIMRSWRRRLILASARRADCVITPSQTMANLIVGWRPRLAEKIELCPYGTRSELFAPTAVTRPWREDGQLRLIYVSVYYPHKNPGVVCRAIDKLNHVDLPTTATITMDLAEVEATRGGTLDAVMMRRSLKSGVLELGRRRYEELPGLYSRHDVFVFPSVSESFGHPMAEAMSMGLPIVAADTAINREICGDGALYFSPFSSADLAMRLRELNSSPALRQRLRQASQERAGSLYRWSDHMTRLMSILERVAAKTGRPLRPAP